MSSKTKVSRVSLKFKEKLELRHYYENNKWKTHEEIRQWCISTFNKSIGRSTVGQVLKQNLSTDLNITRTRNRQSNYPTLDRQLLAFFNKHEKEV